MSSYDNYEEPLTPEEYEKLEQLKIELKEQKELQQEREFDLLHPFKKFLFLSIGLIIYLLPIILITSLFGLFVFAFIKTAFP